MKKKARIFDQLLVIVLRTQNFFCVKKGSEEPDWFDHKEKLCQYVGKAIMKKKKSQEMSFSPSWDLKTNTELFSVKYKTRKALQ